MPIITAVPHSAAESVPGTTKVRCVSRIPAFGALCLALISGLAMTCLHAEDQQSPLTADEKQLADLISQYRQQNGMAAVPVTNSLTEVARAHVQDLNANHPDTATYGTGICNRHSWSDKGVWTSVCYTGSAEASKMWSKPGEISTSYRGSGYEIAFVCVNCEATPAAAMELRSSYETFSFAKPRGLMTTSPGTGILSSRLCPTRSVGPRESMNVEHERGPSDGAIRGRATDALLRSPASRDTAAPRQCPAAEVPLRCEPRSVGRLTRAPEMPLQSITHIGLPQQYMRPLMATAACYSVQTLWIR